MSSTFQEIKEAASTLPIGERAELAQFLLRSLDEDRDEKSLDAEWFKIAEKRSEELRSGKVKGIPAEEVIKNLLKPKQ